MSRIESAAAVLALAAIRAWAQESYLSVRDPSWKGIEIWFETKIEPPGTGSANRLPGGVIVETGRVHHVIKDAAHERYFGYDVLLDPSDDGKSAQLRIEPLRSSQAGFGGRGWTLLALPKYPVIPGVKIGDTVALDLLANAATGQKIVDYLTLRRHGAADDTRSAHDFSLADVEINLEQPQVWIDGKLEASAHVAGGASRGI